MGNTEQNRRRNQIIAERASEKVLRERRIPDGDELDMWDLVIDELARTRKTHAYMGNAGNACRSARALLAAQELKLRGTQLRLFGDL